IGITWPPESVKTVSTPCAAIARAARRPPWTRSAMPPSLARARRLQLARGAIEHAVGAPDLDRDEVGLPVELRQEPRRLARRHLDPAVPDDARADDAVDVREQARLRVVERLRAERARQLGAEHEAADEQDRGARDEEDAEQGERALQRPPLQRMRGRPLVQGESSRAVSAAPRRCLSATGGPASPS